MKKSGVFGLLIGLVLAMVLGGCLDGSDEGGTSWEVMVRVTGLAYQPDGNIPVLWENGGEPDELPSDSREGGAEDIFVSDGDVYVAGSVLGDEGAMVPVYWKNFSPTILPTLGVQGLDGIATSVAAVNGSLHVGGGVGGPGGGALPCEWIDGVVTTLPVSDLGLGGLVNGMFVDGRDVYYVGFVVVPEDIGSVGRPAYWKNGVLTMPTCPEREGSRVVDGIGQAIWVDNGDLYVLAAVRYEDDQGRVEKPIYWKNGEPVALLPVNNEESGWPQDLAVVDGSVYVVGDLADEQGLGKPVVWVDGQPRELSMIDPALIGKAYGIQIHKGKVYISGHTTRMLDPDADPPVLETIGCYWVNGGRVDLSGLGINDQETGVETNGLAIFVSEN